MEPVLTAIIGGVIVGSGALAMLRRAKASRHLLEDAARQTLTRYTQEPLKPLPEQRGWRATLHDERGDKLVIDMSMGSSPVALSVRVHRYISFPSSLELGFVAQRSWPANQQEGSQGSVSLSSPMTFTLDGATFETSVAELLAALEPKLHERISDLADFYTEPLWELKLATNWLTSARTIYKSALSARELKTFPQIQHYLKQLIDQSVALTQLQAINAMSAPQLLEALFYKVDPFGQLRNQALRALMTRYASSPEAERVWRYVLSEGNLYDALLLLNLHQARFLDEITPSRLLALVNGIQQSGRFETSALPQLLTRRFDFRITLNPHLDWEVCQALVTLGMRELPVEQTEDVIVELFLSSAESRRMELIALAQQASYLPITKAFIKPQLQGSVALWLRMAELIEALGERLPDTIVDPELERFLLKLLEQDMDEVSLSTINALAWVGMAPAHQALSQRLKGQGLALGRLPTRARRALAMIEERLKAQPVHGAITLAQEERASGALSVAKAHGELELLDEDPSQPQ